MDIKYLPPSEYAALHGVSTRLIQRLCQQGRIEGTIRIGSRLAIPENAPYPAGTVGKRPKPKKSINPGE